MRSRYTQFRKMKLPQIITAKKKGNESFEYKNQNLDFDLKDFWSWSQSNLIENRTRGILAEFIVKQALDADSENRIEWDDYDLTSKTGKKIEIKSASYIQSWNQKDYSKISFGIAPTYSTEYDDDRFIRRSDFYIFCLLKEKDQTKINPMSLDQWTFYVLETKVLNSKIPEQKTITLNALISLNPLKCDYSELKKVIDK